MNTVKTYVPAGSGERAEVTSLAQPGRVYPGVILCLIVVAGVLLLVNSFVSIRLSGNFEGIILLRDTKNGTYTLADQLLVGDESRIVSKLLLSGGNSRLVFPPAAGENQLRFEWNRKTGQGLVANSFADGTRLITYLGRYLSEGEPVHGLFVGGALPEVIDKNVNYLMNNSGMAYFDGRRWYHIWCTVNEGLASTRNNRDYRPSKWEFLDSTVEQQSDRNVVLRSSHKVVIDSVPLRIDRRMSFTAGEPYLNLEIKITNVGTEPFDYSYFYGDEPWVGYYGSSLGDVGWVQGKLVNYAEEIDPRKYSYVGVTDVGNRVIGEEPVYSNLANFIEWYGDQLPDHVFFTNNLKGTGIGRGVPLSGDERAVGLEWDGHLDPEKTAVIRLAVGMARMNTRTGIPEKPPTSWN